MIFGNETHFKVEMPVLYNVIQIPYLIVPKIFFLKQKIVEVWNLLNKEVKKISLITLVGDVKLIYNVLVSPNN